LIGSFGHWVEIYLRFGLEIWNFHGDQGLPSRFNEALISLERIGEEKDPMPIRKSPAHDGDNLRYRFILSKAERNELKAI